ncbi:transmembrane emp24 domain-containing protein 7 [Sigmodon hispidus]
MRFLPKLLPPKTIIIYESTSCKLESSQPLAISPPALQNDLFSPSEHPQTRYLRRQNTAESLHRRSRRTARPRAPPRQRPATPLPAKFRRGPRPSSKKAAHATPRPRELTRLPGVPPAPPCVSSEARARFSSHAGQWRPGLLRASKPRSSVEAAGMLRPGSAPRWVAAAGGWGCRLLPLLLLLLPGPSGASEITFELPDNAKQCFYEDIIQGTKCTLEFQVITGGHYDVDCRLEDPDGKVLYKEMKKQYDSFTFTASRNGTYKFCFSNEFSTFTHKTVYFDFQVGEDPPLFPSENRVSALTQMESACVSIHEALKSVIDYQTHFRLREAQGRSRAEDLNTRVAYWSVGEALILLVVSIGQVFLLKSFFSDKRTTTTRVGS